MIGGNLSAVSGLEKNSSCVSIETGTVQEATDSDLNFELLVQVHFFHAYLCMKIESGDVYPEQFCSVMNTIQIFKKKPVSLYKRIFKMYLMDFNNFNHVV